MARFNDYIDTTALAHAHANLIVVLVEGQTDQDFLERMFPDLNTELRFEAVHGCTVLPRRLSDERRTCPKVFGLLDRDYLKREQRWVDLFQTDDDAFARATRRDGLYILTRWEIENYLLHPDAVCELVRHWRAEQFDEETLIDRMLTDALAELHVTAAWCTAHSQGVGQDSAPAACVDAEVLPNLVADWITRKIPSDAPNPHADHIAKVEAFDPGEGTPKRDRVLALLRMVDGKRFLERLRRRWLSMPTEDPSNQLAANAGRIRPKTDDLSLILEELRAAQR